MLLIKLLPVLALLAGSATAAPLKTEHTLSKRAIPFVGGVNLAGCDFGMNTDGSSGTSYCPGTDQIAHFKAQGANHVRFPVGWQYLVGNNQASTSFDAAFFAKYDNLVKTALKAGLYVMIDVHNYARWNGAIIGQGGPTNAQFASLWTLLAKAYANEPNVIFGIMNEPHDVDITAWGATVQAAVNAIRSAGATSQTIAIPGNFYTHSEPFYQSQNGPVVNVKDPAGADNSKLIFDVHQYLDGDGSGQARECVTNNVDKFTLLADWLEKNGRKAIISETGGGNTQSCITNLGQQLAFIKSRPSAFAGFTIWSAGSFDSSYPLGITPVNGVDNDLFLKAIKPDLPGAGGAVLVPASSSKAATSSAAATSSRPAASSSAAPAASSSARPSVAPSSSRAAVPSSSSRAVVPSSSSKAAVPSTSKAAIPSSSKAAVPSSQAPATPSSSKAPTTTAAPTAGNLQIFTGAIGGISAPAVTASGNQFKVGTNTFNFVADARQRSCYTQMDLCQNAANQSGNKPGFTVGDCNGQISACLAKATA